MKLFRAQSTRCLMAALLVLVMGVIGPVQASVHAGSMAAQATQQAVTDAVKAEHAGHHIGHEHSALPATGHAGADSPCVELCLLMSLAPSVSSEFMQPDTDSAFIAPAGAPNAQGQPATPPPKRLF